MPLRIYLSIASPSSLNAKPPSACEETRSKWNRRMKWMKMIKGHQSGQSSRRGISWVVPPGADLMRAMLYFFLLTSRGWRGFLFAFLSFFAMPRRMSNQVQAALQ
ncbi:hypothetical protein SODALDRAFT_103234 [Sodiomyces alkalinus F11]|uniref:Uncharacterized protein n=1 Tax=Sodiomyces alkalinus (strain CBS 110278 / VKM F-3762 / F11) TaxID=1314773 RepID=A0A3N2Q217_SODAK|nr:hypothetical protein SODALDRAFT_103234 [Sodiomyces alkalinus F11]ROT40718.1 hypothetical protein SODALDRAFT_103234 [Sodiomyces alkalinus F11]